MELEGNGMPEELDEQAIKSKEKEICQHVRSLVEDQRASASRTAHESIWMNNIAALLGLTGSWNAVTRSFDAPVNKVRNKGNTTGISVNKILPTVQIRQAKLCQNPPRYDVRPESNSTEDKEAARLGLDILKWVWDLQHIDEKRLNATMWLQECGHAYLKVSWDPTLGKEMVDPETGEMGYEGDIRVDVVSAFSVFPDPLAATLEDATYIIEAKVRKLDYFKMQYPEKGMEVEPEDVWLLSLQYEERIKSMNVRGPATSFQQNVKDCAIELIKYEKRSKDYPNGRMIITANGVLLEDKELPVGDINFAKFDDVMIGGKYYSEAIITHLRPLNEQSNNVVRKRADWVNKMLAGKYSAARGSGLTQESLNDQSGEILYYDIVPNAPNGGMPMPMQIPNIPQYAYQEEEKLDEQINYVAGTSDVSRGDMPSAGMPAVGMQLLLEADATRMGATIEQHEHSYAKVGTLILKYAEKFYTMERTMKIAGKSGFMVKTVTGEMLRGNTDCIVVKGSTIPGSKVLRRQELVNAYQLGILGEPNDTKVREKVLAAMEFGDISEMWRKQALDEYQFMLGVKQIEKGEMPVAHKYDNHEYWIQQLNEYRIEKTDDLPPLQAALIETLVNQHMDFLVEIANVNAPPMLPTPPPLAPPPQVPPPPAAPPGMGAPPNPQGPTL